MKFLDRKEQVLELQMTQYGKSVLSRGAFKPMYYAFFDDDVIYDSQYMSSGSATPLELSMLASDRIREAVRPEVQYNFAGVETNIAKLSEVSENQEELSIEEKLEELTKPPSAIDNYYSLGIPMGTSEYNSRNIPSWQVSFHNGEITGSVTDYTGSSGLVKIPQLEVEAYYDIEAKQYTSLTDEEINALSSEDKNVSIFNNFYVEINKGYILVDFAELGSLFENNNFDLEVYEIIEEPNSLGEKETLKPLYFIDSKNVATDILIEDSSNDQVTVTKKNVEYFFDVRVDDEIGDNVGLVGTDSTGLYKSQPENDEEPC